MDEIFLNETEAVNNVQQKHQQQLKENIVVMFYSDNNGEKPGIIFGEHYPNIEEAIKDAHIRVKEYNEKKIPGGQIRVQKILESGNKVDIAYETIGA